MAASLNLSRRGFPRLLSARLPFFYGWVVLACLCCAGFSRQGGATATLSIFVEPLTREFGWSRTAVSGAVSLGGVLAALVVAADRPGARPPRLARWSCASPCSSPGSRRLLLSLTQSLLVFYLLFCVARLNWAGPFDLGIYSALNNWFVAPPRLRHLDRDGGADGGAGGDAADRSVGDARTTAGAPAGWRSASTVLVVGFMPIWLLMVRRPEDLGLLPDRRRSDRAAADSGTVAAPVEPTFSRRQAVAHPGVLAAAALHRAGLSGAGRGQPASGGQSDRTRHRADHRGDDRQPVLADVGGRERRLRVAAARVADPLPAGGDRRLPRASAAWLMIGIASAWQGASPRHCSASASAAC